MNEYERMRNRLYYKFYTTIVKEKQMEDEFEQWMRQTFEKPYDEEGWDREGMKAAFRAGQEFSNRLEPQVNVNFAELESIKYLNKMRELMNLGDNININARLLILRRKIIEDIELINESKISA